MVNLTQVQNFLKRYPKGFIMGNGMILLTAVLYTLLIVIASAFEVLKIEHITLFLLSYLYIKSLAQPSQS